jgi:hypothetical protein
VHSESEGGGGGGTSEMVVEPGRVGGGVTATVVNGLLSMVATSTGQGWGSGREEGLGDSHRRS